VSFEVTTPVGFDNVAVVPPTEAGE